MKRLPEESLDKNAISDDEMGEFEDPWEDEMEESSEEEQHEQEEDKEDKPDLNVYLPGQALAEGEELVADPSAYDMLHSLNVEWPCLSFDIIQDNMGQRSSWPLSTYFVAGSQADKADQNKIYIMKASNLYKTKQDDSDSEDEDDDQLDEDPVLEYKTISHYGGVNRIRVR